MGVVLMGTPVAHSQAPDAEHEGSGVPTAATQQQGAPAPGSTCDVASGFVYAPAGTFMMGSPPGRVDEVDGDETQHEVTLPYGFCIQATETTQAEWQGLMATTPSQFSRCGSHCPVEQVSWLDAIAYANARSRSEGLNECYDPAGNTVGGGNIYDCTGYRLPTEAEWEYAARAGSTDAQYGSLDAVAWYAAPARRHMGTQPVGQLQPNAWGLHDMLGNVWEWTHDWYEAYPGGVADPDGGVVGTNRVVRGGSWNNDSHFVRVSNRNFESPGYRSGNVGFRLVRSAP